VAIDCNTKELVLLGNKVNGFAWEMRRMADMSDLKGKSRAVMQRVGLSMF